MKTATSPIARWPSILRFGFAYFAVAGVIGPGLVLWFNIGIVEPESAGWPLASVLIKMAAIVAPVATVAFAVGTYIPTSKGRFRANRLRTFSVLSAGMALVAPFLILVCHSALRAMIQSQPTSTGPMVFPANVAVMFLIVMALGHFTVRFS